MACFDPNLSGESSLLLSSYLGGNDDDWGWGIAASGDSICVAGSTESTNFNTTGGYQTSIGGNRDAFITLITDIYPEISVDPASKDYGTVYIGSSSTQTFTIYNTGAAPLFFDTLELAGSYPQYFSILNDNCSDTWIAASGSKTFQVRFTPTIVGAVTARVNIPNSDPDEGMLYVNLSGTGATPPGITVSPTSGLVTSESGATDDFTIVLDTQPTGNVTIGISSSNTAEGTVSQDSVTFTTDNWSSAETITVTGVDDSPPVDDGNIAYTIITAAAISSDSNYNNMNPSDVSVTNNDNDTAGITVSPTSGLVTSESGATDDFTIVLDTQPTGNVTIGISSSNTDEGTVSQDSVTFTTDNWSSAETITVTGVDDYIDDGNIAYTIITAAAVSSDSNYNNMNPADVSVTNNDNDTAGITVSPTSGLVTSESGATDNFTIVLDTQPTGNVTIGISSSNTAEGTVSQDSVTFTTDNWSSAQTIIVTGVDDSPPVVDGNIAYTIITAAAVSSDSNYNNMNPADVGATNNDNDTAGATVSPTSGLVTSEAGTTATFTIVLDTKPSDNVTFSLSSSNTAEGTVSQDSVTFTTDNWSSAQTITVTGVDDSPPVADGNIAYWRCSIIRQQL